MRRAGPAAARLGMEGCSLTLPFRFGSNCFKGVSWAVSGCVVVLLLHPVFWSCGSEMSSLVCRALRYF